VLKRAQYEALAFFVRPPYVGVRNRSFANPKRHAYQVADELTRISPHFDGAFEPIPRAEPLAVRRRQRSFGCCTEDVARVHRIVRQIDDRILNVVAQEVLRTIGARGGSRSTDIETWTV
jgi:hypothetical protein